MLCRICRWFNIGKIFQFSHKAIKIILGGAPGELTDVATCLSAEKTARILGHDGYADLNVDFLEFRPVAGLENHLRREIRGIFKYSRLQGRGVPQGDVQHFYCLVGPAGMSVDFRKKLAKAFDLEKQEEAVVKQLLKLVKNMDSRMMSAKTFEKFVSEDEAKHVNLILEDNMKIEQ